MTFTYKQKLYFYDSWKKSGSLQEFFCKFSNIHKDELLKIIFNHLDNKDKIYIAQYSYANSIELAANTFKINEQIVKFCRGYKKYIDLSKNE